MAVSDYEVEFAALGAQEGGERVRRLAERLERANSQIEVLEDRLAAARADVRAERRQVERISAQAERDVQAAKDRSSAAGRRQRPAEPAGGVMVDGQQRLSLNKTESAAVLGVSVDFFDRHVAHELACVRRGRRRLYSVNELKAWLDRESERVG